MLFYGFAKLNGSQFTILNSELDKPMGEVSGFWLTWYYYGYSPFYGNLVGLAQISGGILLMFRKTTLLGACILFPIVTNIILIDIFYGIGALLAAVGIDVALINILITHKQELLDLFWTKQNSLFQSKSSTRSVLFIKYAVRILMILSAALFTYWVANYNNRSPTPLDGTWDVIAVSSNLDSTADIPSVIFFERNRAYLCVFKEKDGKYVQHHFEVNPQERIIKIWQRWLQKGAKIYDGHYEMVNTRLQLKSMLTNKNEESMITLRKRS